MSSPSATKRGHRGDIDGLRALAVAAVVAFHVRLPLSTGGFIGVDVFFVVSGFLITGILAAEADRSGGIALGRFYARRVRRLLPAATLTILATMAASYLLVSPLSWKRLVDSAIAAALYFSNLAFAAAEDNYFAADVQSDPLLHFWSLAVEEQFYIVWPLLVLGLSRLGPRARIGGLAAIGVVSFVHSVALAQAGSPWAYYSPLSRAWEFAAGGLLALLVPAGIRGLRSEVRTILAFAGLALLGVTMVSIDVTTPFPGIAAIPVVVGTMLLIAAAPESGSWIGRVLESPPFQYIGRLSYSWYLWHWPFLVIGQIWLASNEPSLRIALALASLALSALTHPLIENRVRFLPALAKATTPNLALAACLIIVVVATGVGLDRAADAELASPELAPLIEVRDDVPELLGNDCNTDDVETLLDRCRLGDLDASRTILVLGDSHAETWTPALGALANEFDARIVIHTLGGCSVTGLPSTVDADGCRRVQGQNLPVLDELQPDALIVSHFAENLDDLDDDDWREGVRDFVEEIERRGVPLGWIFDSPSYAYDVVECVSLDGEDACRRPRAEITELPDRMRALEEPILIEAGATTFDPLPLMCAETCPLSDGVIFRYRDRHHLAATYVTSLAPAFRPFLTELLRQ